MTEPTTQDRFRGMFAGIAIGDALGMPVETMTADQIAAKYGPVINYIEPRGHKWFDGRPAGTTTDDTQLTLVVAESLIACKGMDMDDMARRHVESWRTEGDKGFGGSTRDAVKKLAEGEHWSRSGKSGNPKRGKGNGVPMKIAPYAAYIHARNYTVPREEMFGDILALTRMTHHTELAEESAVAHLVALDTCLRMSAGTFEQKYLLGEINMVEQVPGVYERCFHPREECLAERLYGMSFTDWSKVAPGDIINRFGGGKCHVYDSLPFTYAFFLRNPHSVLSLYEIVNAGGDTDTNASIAGGMLGALNGLSVFPKHLLDGLKERDRVLDAADRFYRTFA